VDIYEPGSVPSAQQGKHHDDHEKAREEHQDGTSDDRLAESFRREFLDAQAARNAARKPPAPPATKAKGPAGAAADDRPRGPKLGGSRSARASMKAAEEEKKKKGGKGGKR